MSATGLFLENDTSPTTSTLGNVAWLINNISFSNQTIQHDGPDAVGIYFGGSDYTVKTISLTMRATSGQPTAWHSTSTDDFHVYRSDNGSSWTLVESFSAPTIFSNSDATPNYSVDLTLTSTVTAKYIKVVFGAAGIATATSQLSRTVAINAAPEDITSTSFTHYGNTQWGNRLSASDNNRESSAQGMTFLAIDFGAPRTLASMRVFMWNGYAAGNMNGRDFQGSNNSTDGSNGDWTTLATFSTSIGGNIYSMGWSKTIGLPGTQAFRLYRCATMPANSNTLIAEWEMHEVIPGLSRVSQCDMF